MQKIQNVSVTGVLKKKRKFLLLSINTQNTQTGKNKPINNILKVKKVAKKGEKDLFFSNYGNFSLISFAH